MNDAAAYCYLDSSEGREQQRQLEIKRLLYWSRRLVLLPDEVRQLTLEELQQRLSIMQQTQQQQEALQADFKRWQRLNDLRFLMYEEQLKFNQKYGEQAWGVSIWRILSQAQEELELKLQLDELRGSDCARYPSPMSIMSREQGGARSEESSVAPASETLVQHFEFHSGRMPSRHNLYDIKVPRPRPKRIFDDPSYVHPLVLYFEEKYILEQKQSNESFQSALSAPLEQQDDDDWLEEVEAKQEFAAWSNSL
ncbi:uncharacterized protein LOC108599544 [Drosophila busckii]|uniref:uncharacterized protein LOC108599544 n=1 Tax=Drosophila busckii TaxID=30019 RepID=UPI00083F0072|nr:uncharacterized protein LOC108599544 [Drosophila busckii]